jgi:hypothetical protein
MKEMDCVEVIIENDSYAKEGVHQGMQGWICDSRCINGRWLVIIPQYGEKENIATLPIKEIKKDSVKFNAIRLNRVLFITVLSFICPAFLLMMIWRHQLQAHSCL